MSKNLDRAAIIAELKREALNDPETGWLSDMSRRGIEWDDFNEVINIQRGDGSVDVGHLAEIVEHLIETATKPLLRRVEAAEAKLERVREVCESSAFDCNTREWGNLEAVATDDVLTALDGGDQT